MRITAAGPYPYKGSLLERMKQLRINEYLGGASLIPHENVQTAVLVIDEQDDIPGSAVSVRYMQSEVLKQADMWGWPTVFVQYWKYKEDLWPAAAMANPPRYQGPDYPKVCVAARTLRAYVREYHWFTKVTASAFGYKVLQATADGFDADWVSLHDWFQERGVRRLIVLGQQVNYCVFSTVVNLNLNLSTRTAGRDGPDSRGATDLGYTVLTCDQILSGGEVGGFQATWKDEAAIEFYDAF